MQLPKYVTIEKKVGETPLAAMESWRARQGSSFANAPLAYAGRLDPMASGKLLVLIGDECKRQEKYHAFDKRYEFSVLFGVTSDTNDVLGRLTLSPTAPNPTATEIAKAAARYIGAISLPYPHFSSKTVKGKPLHTWTLEGRLDEITIPTNTSTVYSLELTSIEHLSRSDIFLETSQKIETIPTVTDERKSIGNDFRRIDVRQDWKLFSEFGRHDDVFTVAHFSCIASSGTYMRSLAKSIGEELQTHSLAYHIHRTHIGKYIPLPFNTGIWLQKF